MSVIAKIVSAAGQGMASVAAAMKGPAPTSAGSDPFHNDLARREAINAASDRRASWLRRRPGWLRRRGAHDPI